MQQAIHDIVTPYREATRTHGTKDWIEDFDRTKLFTALQEQRFPHSQNIDTAGMIDRVLSFSYMAKLPQPEKDDVRERLRTLASTLPERFDLMYVTTVFCCHAREVASPQ